METLLDWSGFLERLEHNLSLALELAEDLLPAIDKRTENLEREIYAKDQKRIEQAAHALRGLLSPYGPKELLVRIKSMEEKARSQSLVLDELPDELRSMLGRLKEEVQREIDQLLNQGVQRL